MMATMAKSRPAMELEIGGLTRIFSRGMSWVCLALVAVMVFVGAAATQSVVSIASHGLVSCGHSGEKACADGGTTTIAQVDYDPDGHVIGRRTLSATPPEMRRWTQGNIASLFGAAPPLLLALALLQGSQLFAGLAGGRVFRATTVQRLTRFATLGVLFLLSDSLLEPVVNLVLKLIGPESVRFSWPFTVFKSSLRSGAWTASSSGAWMLSGAGVMVTVFAAVLIAMVSVLARATAIAEDHAQIV